MIDYSKDYTVDKIEFNPDKTYPCVGKFIDPTEEEIRYHSKRPFKMFTPNDGSYKQSYYNEQEIIKAIK